MSDQKEWGMFLCNLRTVMCAVIVASFLLPILVTSADATEVADDVRAIIAALENNKFVVKDPSGMRHTSLSLNHMGFKFAHIPPDGDKQKKQTCHFETGQRDTTNKKLSKILFFDVDCDGVLDYWGGGNDKTEAIDKANEEARASYPMFVKRYKQIMLAMQAFGSNYKPPIPFALPDFAALSGNRQLLAEILRHLESTKITQDSKKYMIFAIDGSNGIALHLAAYYEGGTFTNCIFSEQSKEGEARYLDEGCNGSIDAFKRPDGTNEEAESWGMAPVMRSFVMDIGRFTAFAADALPKQ
jgi:hypothetical protein